MDKLSNRNVLNALTAAPTVSNWNSKSGWRISAVSGKILSSVGQERAHLEALYSELPGMFFQENLLELAFNGGNNRDDTPCAGIKFTAADALSCVKKTCPSDLEVYSAKEWQESRQQQIAELRNSGLPAGSHHNYDWTFNTDYKGTFFSVHGAKLWTESTNENLDWHNLQRRDEPILFSASIPLYEDELEDFGSAEILARFRAMPSGFFMLLRYFLRVDNVKFVANETRVRYVPRPGDQQNEISFLRTFVAKESSFESVCQRIGDQFSIFEVDRISSILETKQEVRERVFINLKS